MTNADVEKFTAVRKIEAMPKRFLAEKAAAEAEALKSAETTSAPVEENKQ